MLLTDFLKEETILNWKKKTYSIQLSDSGIDRRTSKSLQHQITDRVIYQLPFNNENVPIGSIFRFLCKTSLQKTYIKINKNQHVKIKKKLIKIQKFVLITSYKKLSFYIYYCRLIYKFNIEIKKNERPPLNSNNRLQSWDSTIK